MSHLSPEKKGWIRCEFAMMHDCTESDEDYCSTHKDPDDCEKYHRKMVAEGEESKAVFEAWKANNAWAKVHLKNCYSLSEKNRPNGEP